jgi:Aminotransferase class-V
MTTHPALHGEPIYLDYNATTPVDPAVVTAMQPYLDTRFGNPSSAHRYATTPAQALATARGQVAALIGGDPAGIVFTGSGSEASRRAGHLPRPARAARRRRDRPARRPARAGRPAGPASRDHPAYRPRIGHAGQQRDGACSRSRNPPASPTPTAFRSTPTPCRPRARSRSM